MSDGKKSAGRRVLITGASGQLGGNMLMNLPENWEITGIVHTHMVTPPAYHIGIRRADLLTENIDALIDSFSPLDAVINAAALTNVDYCEMHKREGWRLNALLPKMLAESCARRGIHFVHISTDHVFDGKKGAYGENDDPHPINYYAETKRAAEKFVESAGGIFTIIRTNFFGYHVQRKRGIAGWILQTLERHEPLTLFTDISFSPILVNALVPCIREVIERELTGMMHIASRDSCSKYEFGMKIAKAFELSTESVVPLTLKQSHLLVPRPTDMSLVVERAQSLLETPLPTIDESISQYRHLQEIGYSKRLRTLLANHVSIGN